MSQGELFYESYLDALKDDVKAIGGAKEVGHKFWPQKHLEAARNCVNDRLNPDRRERFDDDQERFIMRAAREVRGFSAALFYLCDDTGFERPPAKTPQANEDRLAEAIADLAKQSEKLIREAQALQERKASLRAV